MDRAIRELDCGSDQRPMEFHYVIAARSVRQIPSSSNAKEPGIEIDNNLVETVMLNAEQDEKANAPRLQRFVVMNITGVFAPGSPGRFKQLGRGFNQTKCRPDVKG